MHSSPQDVHESPREVYPRETEKAPVKTGWAETDKGRPGRPNVRARWVEGIQDTREARVVRVDAAAGGGCRRSPRVHVEERLWHSSTCEEPPITLHREGGYSFNCRLRVTRQVVNTCAGRRKTAFTARATPQKLGEEELASTLSDHKLTRGFACPCVRQGCIKGEHIVATVHGVTSRLVENDRQWNSSSK